MPNRSDIDAAFKALADPVRRSMVDRLSKGPASVKELAAPHGISLPAVMQHIALLDACGVVTTQKTGRVRTVTLTPGALDGAHGWLTARRDAWSSRLDRLADHLDNEEDQTDGTDRDTGRLRP